MQEPLGQGLAEAPAHMRMRVQTQTVKRLRVQNNLFTKAADAQLRIDSEGNNSMELLSQHSALDRARTIQPFKR